MRRFTVALSFLFIATHSVACWSQTVSANRVLFDMPDSTVVSSIIPMSPTTEDSIDFVLATDGVTYGNSCEQLFGFGGGALSMDVDETNFMIQIDLIGDPPAGCFTNFDPVQGIQGSLGPLAAGEWDIQTSFGGNETLTFTVEPAAVPEPGSVSLLLLAASLTCSRRQRRTDA